MLATRIIPTLLHRGETLVKGRQFDAWRSVGHVQQAARIHALRAVDELVILDIGATPAGEPPNFDLVLRLTEGNFTPIAVGGGIKTTRDVRQLLASGADKVVVGTEILVRPSLIDEIARNVGSQALVAAIDYRQGTRFGGMVSCRANTQFYPQMNAVEWAKECELRGAGEILLTNIHREGMMQGYDLRTIDAVARTVGIPVIAHGGCGTYEHMHEAIQAGASAVAAGAMFQFTDQTPRGAAEYLAAKGHTVRL